MQPQYKIYVKDHFNVNGRELSILVEYKSFHATMPEATRNNMPDADDKYNELADAEN